MNIKSFSAEAGTKLFFTFITTLLEWSPVTLLLLFKTHIKLWECKTFLQSGINSWSLENNNLILHCVVLFLLHFYWYMIEFSSVHSLFIVIISSCFCLFLQAYTAFYKVILLNSPHPWNLFSNFVSSTSSLCVCWCSMWRQPLFWAAQITQNWDEGVSSCTR